MAVRLTGSGKSATANAEVFSVTLDLENTGKKIRFMMVSNKPRPNSNPVPQQKPAA